MNVHFIIIGATMVVAIIAFGWFGYRFYKRIGRRCRRKNCGRTGVKRVSKILFPPDETVSCRSNKGQWRWFIRRPLKLTFTSCKCSWVELVKIDADPISLWHAYWVKLVHKEQYYLDDQILAEAARRKIRQLYLGGKHENLAPEVTDTPPISLETLFRDFLEELEELTEVVGEGKEEENR